MSLLPGNSGVSAETCSFPPVLNTARQADLDSPCEGRLPFADVSFVDGDASDHLYCSKELTFLAIRDTNLSQTIYQIEFERWLSYVLPPRNPCRLLLRINDL